MASDSNAGKLLRSVNPATLEVIGEVALPGTDEIHAAVARARRTGVAWAELCLTARLKYIARFRQLLMQESDATAQLIAREAGKPVGEALVAEVFSVLETCTWLQENVPATLAPEPVEVNRLLFTFKKAYNIFEPVGVVAIISPWNFPFSIPTSTILTALAVGNTVVLKPSPKTPLVAEWIRQLVSRAGFPEGCLEIVHGDRLEAKTLVESDIDRVFFTGSVAGGKAIMSLAAPGLKQVSLELGGKHPAIVLADSDPEKCADAIVWSAFTNTGQACASIERLYVEDDIYEPLVESIVRRTVELRMGNPLEATTDIGPMIDEGQFLRVAQLVKSAVEAGATLVTGGRVLAQVSPELAKQLPGFYMEPTILGNVDQNMAIAGEEVFGPVLTIVRVKSVEEAIELANKSRLALGASIWTRDLGRAEQLARRIKAGMVWVNDGLYSHACPDAPWGGRGDSGFGKTHGKHALLEMVHIKHIGVEAQGKRDWNFPYSRNQTEMVRASLGLMHGKDWLGRAGALLRLIPRAVRQRFGKPDTNEK